MKGVCPHCRTALKIPDEKIPDQGGMAKCPHCGQRLRIQKTESSQPQLHQPAPIDAPSTGPSTWDQWHPKVSAVPPGREAGPTDHPLRATDHSTDHADGEFDFESNPPVIYPYTGSRSIYMVAIGLLLILLAWGAYLGLRTPAVVLEGPTRQTLVTKEEEAARARLRMTQDLNALRIRIQQRNYMAYSMEMMGPEFRMAFGFLDRCGLDCPYLTRVHMLPLSDQSGFQAEVDCTGHDKYLLLYRWTVDRLETNGESCP